MEGCCNYCKFICKSKMEKMFSFQLPLTFSTGTEKNEKKAPSSTSWKVITGRTTSLTSLSSLCVICNVGLVWKEGMLRKKCGEEKFHEANYWKSIFISIPLPSNALFLLFPLLCYTFHFQQPSAKKNSSINLLQRQKRKKENEKNCIFLLPCSEVGNIFLDISVCS